MEASPIATAAGSMQKQHMGLPSDQPVSVRAGPKTGDVLPGRCNPILWIELNPQSSIERVDTPSGVDGNINDGIEKCNSPRGAAIQPSRR